MQYPISVADDPPEKSPSTSPSTVHVLANVVAFQIVWVSTIVGAANSTPWLGIGAAAAILVGHLWAVPNRGQALSLVLLTALIGFTADSLFAASGAVQYGSGQATGWLAPGWILGLWVAFATTLNVALRWLQKRWALASVLGAVSGPVSYLAASKIGAVSFADTTLAMIAMAVAWAVLLPSLLALALRLSADPTTAAREVSHD